MKRFLAAMALVGSLVMLGGRADAQSGYFQTPMEHTHLEIEVHALFAYYDGYGLGFGGGIRFGIPLFPNGFGHAINNSFGLSVGADFYWVPDAFVNQSFFAVPIHVDVQWNVFITPRFSVFAETGPDPELHFWSGCGGGCPSTFVFWWDFALGARYHFGDRNGFPALIARVGTSGFTFGISF